MDVAWMRRWAEVASDVDLDASERRHSSMIPVYVSTLDRARDQLERARAELEVLRTEKALRLVDKIEKAGKDSL